MCLLPQSSKSLKKNLFWKAHTIELCTLQKSVLRLVVSPYLTVRNAKCRELILLHLFRGCKNEVILSNWMCFPDSLVGKESACNGGKSYLIPGSGRSTGEGIGYYSFQYSWASRVAQLVKNPPAMRETWVQSLGWEDPLEKGKATHSSILA